MPGRQEYEENRTRSCSLSLNSHERVKSICIRKSAACGVTHTCNDASSSLRALSRLCRSTSPVNIPVIIVMLIHAHVDRSCWPILDFRAAIGSCASELTTYPSSVRPDPGRNEVLRHTSIEHVWSKCQPSTAPLPASPVLAPLDGSNPGSSLTSTLVTLSRFTRECGPLE